MRILVVDPDVVSTPLFIDWLKDRLHPVEIDHVIDGVAAEQKVYEVLYDFVIIEVILPKLNGWELARMIGGLNERQGRKVKCISHTKIGHHLNKTFSNVYGFDEIFDKPLEDQERERLIAVLQRT